jgi:hypothetical protein
MCVYWLLYDHVQVCTFYQRGLCSYGNRCRYEHVKLSRPVSNNPLPPLPRPSVVALNSSPDTSRAEESSSNTHTQSAWQLTEGKANLGPRFLEEDDEKDVEEIEMPTSNDPSEIPICAFAAAGICPRGDNCPQIHGDLCPTCGKHCLHAFRPSERDNHRQQCDPFCDHQSFIWLGAWFVNILCIYSVLWFVLGGVLHIKWLVYALLFHPLINSSNQGDQVDMEA